MPKKETELTGIDEVLNSLFIFIKANKGQYNKFGKYKYRSGEDIIEAVKKELKKDIYPKSCTIVSRPSLEVVLDRIFVKVTTTLKVDSQSVSADGFAEHGLNKKGMDDAQLTGATSAYAKKYSFQNLFQLDESEEDIDGKEPIGEDIVDIKDKGLRERIEKTIKDIPDRFGINIYFKDFLGKHNSTNDFTNLEKNLLNDKMRELNLEFDKDKKEFVEKADVTQKIPPQEELATQNEALTEAEEEEIKKEEGGAE